MESWATTTVRIRGYFNKVFISFKWQIVPLLFLPLVGSGQVVGDAEDGRIKFSGYYEYISLSRPIQGEPYYSPIFFFEDGSVLRINSLVTDKELKYVLDGKRSNSKLYSKYAEFGYWGTYNISGDTLTAHVYIRYIHAGFPRWKLRLTHFQGIIQGDSIINWHYIEPYPKVMDEDASTFSARHTLVFRPSEITRLIDPSRAWTAKK